MLFFRQVVVRWFFRALATKNLPVNGFFRLFSPPDSHYTKKQGFFFHQAPIYPFYPDLTTARMIFFRKIVVWRRLGRYFFEKYLPGEI